MIYINTTLNKIQIMNNITDNLNVKLIDIVSQLSSKEQKKVLDFAISLHYKEKIKEWDNISDEEAASLKAEFALRRY